MSDHTIPSETREADMDVDVAATSTNRLPIKTYHCRFCSHLLIASTMELLSSASGAGGAAGEGPLKRRAGPPGLDHALILRLPGVRKKTTPVADSIPGGSVAGNYDITPNTSTGTTGEPEKEKNNKETAQQQGGNGQRQEQAHYTIPLSTLIPETKPIIIRREDGFEKRILLKCGRCRVVVGYEIDSRSNATTSINNQDEESDYEDDYDNEDEDEIEGTLRKRRRKDAQDRAIYLLPGSIVGTRDLADIVEGEADAVNGMVERNTVLKGMEREWMDWIK